MLLRVWRGGGVRWEGTVGMVGPPSPKSLQNHGRPTTPHVDARPLPRAPIPEKIHAPTPETRATPPTCQSRRVRVQILSPRLLPGPASPGGRPSSRLLRHTGVECTGAWLRAVGVLAAVVVACASSPCPPCAPGDAGEGLVSTCSITPAACPHEAKGPRCRATDPECGPELAPYRFHNFPRPPFPSWHGPHAENGETCLRPDALRYPAAFALRFMVDARAVPYWRSCAGGGLRLLRDHSPPSQPRARRRLARPCPHCTSA